MMKILFPLVFIFMGGIFILVSTIFYPSITEGVISLQAQNDWIIPEFWNLPLVLRIVRVIFLLVGAILIASGIVFFWIKK